jgi:hypothetical protein
MVTKEAMVATEVAVTLVLRMAVARMKMVGRSPSLENKVCRVCRPVHSHFTHHPPAFHRVSSHSTTTCPPY